MEFPTLTKIFNACSTFVEMTGEDPQILYLGINTFKEAYREQCLHDSKELEFPPAKLCRMDYKVIRGTKRHIGVGIREEE